MERLKRSFRNSFRRKKSTHQTESSKPHQWDGDEIAVRNGNCSFPVKYLGCIQVQDSRGMHICEQALITLKAQKGKSIKGQLYVSGDGLRVVDDETKGLIVDQTIEKVSFCAPDRNHDRGFSYICRDGTTRRWMCHGFLAYKDTGDRLSHSVGCSFAVCLERKQKRDAKLEEIKSSATNALNNTSLNSASGSMVSASLNSETETNLSKQFNRTGSFRRIPLKQRMKDPQEAILIEPLPVKEVHNPFAIERPHATPQLLERQGSCRIFRGLNQNSPFKRQLSLRFTPSQMERQRKNSLQQQDDSFFNKFDTSFNNPNPTSTVATVNQEDKNDLSAMCKYMTENLTMLSNKQDLFDDNFQFNNFNSSKSPSRVTKTNLSTSTSKTSTNDSLTNSIQHKTIISLDSNSPFKNQMNTSKSSSPLPDLKTEEKKPRFGQLASYSDDFFFNKQNNSVQQDIDSIANKSNGIMFTDLDEPVFEVNFDKLEQNVTKINVDTGDQSSMNNSSMNSISNSLTSSLNDEINNSSNNINLVNELISVNKLGNNINHNTNHNINHNTNHKMNHSMNHNDKINKMNNLNRKNNLNNLNNNNIMNKKLNDKDIFDPFSSDWVTLDEDLNRSTTNPFLQNLQNLGTTVKAFELKM